MPRERWVIRSGTLIKVSSSYEAPRRGKSGRGMQIIQDIEPYQSPVDDGYVGSRRARKDDLKRHGCREYERGEREYHARERAAQERRFENRITETMQRYFRD
jgi:hypothetical protein